MYLTPVGAVHVKSGEGQLLTSISHHSFELYPEKNVLKARYKVFPFFSVRNAFLDQFSFKTKKVGKKKMVLMDYLNRTYLVGQRVKPKPLSDRWMGVSGRYFPVQSEQLFS